jgi:hypothetical protein
MIKNIVPKNKPIASSAIDIIYSSAKFILNILVDAQMGHTKKI